MQRGRLVHYAPCHAYGGSAEEEIFFSCAEAPRSCPPPSREDECVVHVVGRIDWAEYAARERPGGRRMEDAAYISHP